MLLKPDRPGGYHDPAPMQLKTGGTGSRGPVRAQLEPTDLPLGREFPVNPFLARPILAGRVGTLASRDA